MTKNNKGFRKCHLYSKTKSWLKNKESRIDRAQSQNKKRIRSVTAKICQHSENYRNKDICMNFGKENNYSLTMVNVCSVSIFGSH